MQLGNISGSVAFFFSLASSFFSPLFKYKKMWYKIARISYSCSLSLAFLFLASSIWAPLRPRDPATGIFQPCDDVGLYLLNEII
jgi:predicted membrane-bound mannosyltransferase